MVNDIIVSYKDITLILVDIPFPFQVGKHLVRDTDFFKRLHSIVWSTTIDVETFERTWWEILEEFGLENHDWLDGMYKIRESWIPAFFADVPMGYLIRTTSISESQNSAYGSSFKKGYTLTQV